MKLKFSDNKIEILVHKVQQNEMNYRTFTPSGKNAIWTAMTNKINFLSSTQREVEVARHTVQNKRKGRVQLANEISRTQGNVLPALKRRRISHA